jgi:AbrB family looped-hinge helix DNA binding protein
MRITSKGQITIPQNIRERLGMLPYTEVSFTIEGDAVVVRKSSRESRGARIVGHLRSFGTRLRMSSEELMALTRGEPDAVDTRRLERSHRRRRG